MAKTQEEIAAAEEQIRANQRVIDYQIREYPVEVLVEKFTVGEHEQKNELFVPDYQRDFIWPEDHQSRFIESILIGLPIPYLFAADTSDADEELAGRLEIVDGTQRVRTLAAFVRGGLRLSNLRKLGSLNGFTFDDLPPSRQRRFLRYTMRLIELTEKADEETRRDMFERINTGSKPLTFQEVRRGTRPGKFLDFIRDLANGPLYRKLAPLSPDAVKRFEHQELVLRFFAYLNNYQGFERRVVTFVDEYFESTDKGFDPEQDGVRMRVEWERMLDFVNEHFPNGFRKSEKHSRTPHVRFEAISVGTALALRASPNLKPSPVEPWLGGQEFFELVTSDGANSRPRIVRRIEYVRDRLLSR